MFGGDNVCIPTKKYIQEEKGNNFGEIIAEIHRRAPIWIFQRQHKRRDLDLLKVPIKCEKIL